MLNALHRQIAWRYVRSKRREGFVSVITAFSVLGIMLGVATLILVTSLMNGIRAEMTSQLIGFDGPINIYSTQQSIENYPALIEDVQSIAAVSAVFPRIEGQVMATHQGIAKGAQVVSLPYAAWQQKSIWQKAAIKGDASDLERAEGVVLGQRLAQSLRLAIGDSITLISPQGRATFAGFVPRMKSYPIIATIKTGMHLYDSNLIIMPFESAQLYFQLPNTTKQLEVSIADITQAQAVATTIQQTLSSQYRVYDWQRSNATMLQALTVQRNVMVIILALIVIVAAFNIISSLIMLVQDKQSDIAILRTLGMTRRDVMRIFCAIGTLIGTAGTLMGLGLGLLCARYLEAIKQGIEGLIGQEILIENIYFLSTLPTKTDPTEVVTIVALAIIASFVATLYPAWRAASIHPAEALRYG